MEYDDQIRQLASQVISNCLTFMMNKRSKNMMEILSNKNLNPRLKDILLSLVEQMYCNDEKQNEHIRSLLK